MAEMSINKGEKRCSVNVINDTYNVIWFPEWKVKNLGILSTSLHVTMPKSTAAKNIGIDIVDILGSEISVIDVGKGDTDPALLLI